MLLNGTYFVGVQEFRRRGNREQGTGKKDLRDFQKINYPR
jgi:hypothetical protein